MGLNDPSRALALHILMETPQRALEADPDLFLDRAIEILSSPAQRREFLAMMPNDAGVPEHEQVLSRLRQRGLWALDERDLVAVLSSRTLLGRVDSVMGAADGLTDLPSESLYANLLEVLGAIRRSLGTALVLQPAQAYAAGGSAGPPRAWLAEPGLVAMSSPVPLFWLVLVMPVNGAPGVPAPFLDEAGAIRCPCWGGAVTPPPIAIGDLLDGGVVWVLAARANFLGDGVTLAGLSGILSRSADLLCMDRLEIPARG